MRSRDFITELFDQPYPFKVFDDQAVAKDQQGRLIYIEFARTPMEQSVRVTFDRDQRGQSKFKLTGWGDEHRVISTVVQAVREWARQYRPGMLYFAVDSKEPQYEKRYRMYQTIVKRFLPGSGYVDVTGHPEWVIPDDDNYVRWVIDRLGKYRDQGAHITFLVRDDLVDTGRVDEGWRDAAAAAAVTGALAAGGAAVYDQTRSRSIPTVPAAPAAPAAPAVAKTPAPAHEVWVTNSPHERFLTRMAQEAGLRGTELAQFLAQMAHETGDFVHALERRRDFRKYEPKFARDPKTGRMINVNDLARRLGNDQAGDGERFRGRGYIQLTGRYNYRRAGEALGLDLERDPDQAAQPGVAARIALWYWKNRVSSAVEDFSDTMAVTRRINPGLRGLEDREAKFDQYQRALAPRRESTNETLDQPYPFEWKKIDEDELEWSEQIGPTPVHENFADGKNPGRKGL
ncbi:MAG: hypothetical protein FGM22_10965, partial [Burkholderiaceae bacterium]|nr:hypothetical protein [Burkholderiaceae bacterium]